MTPSNDLPARAQPPKAAKMRSFASLRVVFALILREMSSSYGRSPGGYIWAILEPAAGIALLSFVFAAAFRGPPLGISFPMFYASGMLPFLMFMDIHTKLAQSLNYSKQLLAYPSVTFIDALVARFVLNLLTQLMVGYVIFAVLLLAFDHRTTPNLPEIILAYSYTALLALGFGCFNCYLFIRVPIWQQAWSIMTRPLFILSGIFLLFDSIPEPYSDWLWWNPLVHVVGMMRAAFYPTYDASYANPTYLVLVSLTLLAMGILLLRKSYRDLLQL